MRSDLRQRLAKLAFVTPGMDPNSQAPDQQTMMAQQALGIPPTDPTTGQPLPPPPGALPPSPDPNSGAPLGTDPAAAQAAGAPPPPGGAPPPGADPSAGGAPPVDPNTGQPAPPQPPPPGAIACSVADPNSQQGMQCAIQQQASQSKMAALRAVMDDWSRSSTVKAANAIKQAEGDELPGVFAPPPKRKPGPDMLPDNVFTPPPPALTPQAGPAATVTPIPQKPLPKPGPDKLPDNVFTPPAKYEFVGPPAPTTAWGNPLQAISQGLGNLGRNIKDIGGEAVYQARALPYRFALANEAAEQGKKNMGMYDTASSGPWLPGGLALGGAGLGALIGGRKRRGLGALVGGGLGLGAGLLGQHLLGQYRPQMLGSQLSNIGNAWLGKTGAAFGGRRRTFVKVGLFIGQPTHPHTRQTDTYFFGKLANLSHLGNTQLGQATRMLGAQPSLAQQAVVNYPQLMAPRTPQPMPPALTPQPAMSLAGRGLPQNGPLGSHSGLAGLKGPKPLTGFNSGPGELSAVKSAFEVDPQTAAMLAIPTLGVMGGMIGAPLGAAVGAGRGNVPEGLGRGVIRGASTGLGLGLGATAGRTLGGLVGMPGLGDTLGTGLGAYGGYQLGGELMGEPVGAGPKKRVKKGDLSPELKEEAEVEGTPGLSNSPAAGDVAMPPQGSPAGPSPTPDDGSSGSGDSGAGGDKPPGPEQVNLRDATSAAASCGACGNFDGQGCGLLQMPVQPTQTCDAFSPGPGMAGIDTDAVTHAGMSPEPVLKTAAKWASWTKAGMCSSPYGGRVHGRQPVGLFGRFKQAAAMPPPPTVPKPAIPKPVSSDVAVAPDAVAFNAGRTTKPAPIPSLAPKPTVPQLTTPKPTAPQPVVPRPAPTAPAAQSPGEDPDAAFLATISSKGRNAVARSLAKNRARLAAEAAGGGYQSGYTSQPAPQTSYSDAAQMRRPDSPGMIQMSGGRPYVPAYVRPGAGSFNGQPIDPNITPYGMAAQSYRAVGKDPSGRLPAAPTPVSTSALPALEPWQPSKPGLNARATGGLASRPPTPAAAPAAARPAPAAAPAPAITPPAAPTPVVPPAAPTPNPASSASTPRPSGTDIPSSPFAPRPSGTDIPSSPFAPRPGGADLPANVFAPPAKPLPNLPNNVFAPPAKPLSNLPNNVFAPPAKPMADLPEDVFAPGQPELPTDMVARLQQGLAANRLKRPSSVDRPSMLGNYNDMEEIDRQRQDAEAQGTSAGSNPMFEEWLAQHQQQDKEAMVGLFGPRLMTKRADNNPLAGGYANSPKHTMEANARPLETFPQFREPFKPGQVPSGVAGPIKIPQGAPASAPLPSYPQLRPQRAVAPPAVKPPIAPRVTTPAPSVVQKREDRGGSAGTPVASPAAAASVGGAVSGTPAGATKPASSKTITDPNVLMAMGGPAGMASAAAMSQQQQPQDEGWLKQLTGMSGEELWDHVQRNAVPYGIGAGALGLGALALGGMGGGEPVRRRRRRRPIADLYDEDLEDKEAMAYEKHAAGGVRGFFSGLNRMARATPRAVWPKASPMGAPSIFTGKTPLRKVMEADRAMKLKAYRTAKSNLPFMASPEAVAAAHPQIQNLRRDYIAAKARPLPAKNWSSARRAGALAVGGGVPLAAAAHYGPDMLMGGQAARDTIAQNAQPIPPPAAGTGSPGGSPKLTGLDALGKHLADNWKAYAGGAAALGGAGMLYNAMQPRRSLDEEDLEEKAAHTYAPDNIGAIVGAQRGLLEQIGQLGQGAMTHIKHNAVPYGVGVGAAGLGALGLGGMAAMGKDEVEPVIDPEEERRQRLAALIEAEATGKTAMHKTGFLEGALIGAPLGAIKSPKGHGWEGAARGGFAGGSLATGAGLGGLAGLLGGGLGGAGLGGAAGYGIGSLLGGEEGGRAGLGLGTAGGAVAGGTGGFGLGTYHGGKGGYDFANWLMGPPSWEHKKPKHKKHEEHEKEGHYPGCKSSRKHQSKQKKTKQRRVRRKHASVELVGSLVGIIKQAAAIKCGCGCSTCAKCGTGEKQKVRVINGPQVRTNKGHFAWRGRNAKAVSDDPSYAHFGTKVGSLGIQAATLALSMPAT
jgi:hypothetical protein